MNRSHPDRRGTWPRWLDRWTVLSLPGVAVALLAWGPGPVVGLATIVGIFVALMRVLLTDPPGGLPATAAVWSRTARTAAGGAMLGVSGFAVAAYLPALLLLVLPLQAMTSPPVTARLRRVRTRRLPPSAASATVTPPPDPADTPDPVSGHEADDHLMADMDDRGLCRAWRLSYWVLQDAVSAPDRLAVVRLRECLLDELHRREPHALEAWMGSGARASEGPERYLDRNHDEDHGRGQDHDDPRSEDRT